MQWANPDWVLVWKNKAIKENLRTLWEISVWTGYLMILNHG